MNQTPYVNPAKNGFTLIELLIAMAITGIVSAAIFTAFQSQQKSYLTQDNVVEMQQNLRAAMDIMVREIRMAGYDPLQTANAGFVDNLPYHPSVVLPIDANNIAFTVDDNANGSIDDDDDELFAFKVNNNNELQTFRRGAVNWMTVTENIDVLNFVYLDENRNTPVANLEDIRSIQVTIVAKTNNEDQKYTDNKIYTNLQGTTVLNKSATPDHFHRRMLRTEIKCRNMGLN